MYIFNFGRSADYSIAPAGPVLGGADTVSKRDKNIITLLIASLVLDCIIRANAFLGDGTLS
jgi:hypothetical protein